MGAQIPIRDHTIYDDDRYVIDERKGHKHCKCLLKA